MWFLFIGLVGIALKVLQIGWVATLDWWIILSPLALAIAWWAWADTSGYTKRKIVERENRRRDARIERQRSQLGMLTSRSNRRR